MVIPTTPGRRVEDGTDPCDYRPGDYGRADGAWWVCLPSAQIGFLDDGWEVVEHEDGTISVDPSIHDPGGFHGYLRRGVWIGS